MKKRILAVLLIAVMVIGLCACGNDGGQAGDNSEETKEITIATTTIPSKILEQAKEDFEAKGYKLNIELYDDVFTPNTATEEGSIDGNFYQYASFMDYYNAEKDAHLVSAGRPYYDIPISIYSNKYESLDQVPEGAKVGIYSDASSKTRCFKLLQTAGLIEVDDTLENITALDVTSNPKNLEFIELDSDAKLTASLPDLDLAVLYMQAMVLADLDPEKNLIEPQGDESYAILLVVKEGNENEQWVKDLDEALASDKVRDYINTEFGGALTPLF